MVMAQTHLERTTANMDNITLEAISSLGTNALLILVLWQGLKRFDRLLTLVILLAARGQLSSEELDKLAAQAGVSKVNGGA